jgi:hypothetical protein
LRRWTAPSGERRPPTCPARWRSSGQRPHTAGWFPRRAGGPTVKARRKYQCKKEARNTERRKKERKKKEARRIKARRNQERMKDE